MRLLRETFLGLNDSTIRPTARKGYLNPK